MDRFIWIGNDCVNLDCIARFTVHDDGQRVAVILRDARPEEAEMVIEGDDAGSLLEALKSISIGRAEVPTPSVHLSMGLSNSGTDIGAVPAIGTDPRTEA